MPEPGEGSGEVKRERPAGGRGGPTWAASSTTHSAAQPAATGPKTLTNSVRMAFVLIPAGKFMMGSPTDEAGHRTNEGPRFTKSVIGNAFYLGVHLVMQAVYLAVMGKNPSRFTASEGGEPGAPR